MCSHPPDKYYTVNFFGPIDPEKENTEWCNQIWVGCLDCGEEVAIIIPKNTKRYAALDQLVEPSFSKNEC